MAYANNNATPSPASHGAQFTEFANADGTALKTILTAPAAGKTYKITGIQAVNLDSDTSYDLQFHQNDGSSDFQLTEVAVPSSSGDTNAITPKDVLRGSQFGSLVQEDLAGNKFMLLPAGHTLKAKSTATIDTGAGEKIVVKVDYAVFQ